MAEVKWIKIATNIFDDEKLLLIENLPEADAIIVIWFKLLCMAGKQNNNGVFMLNDKLAYTEEMLATIFRKPLNIVRLALATFEQYGMVEVIDSVITIPNWEKHQNIDGLEKIKEQNRKRVAAYREKQKLLLGHNVENECNVTSNVTNHYSNAIEEDKEEDKNKNIKKKNTKENDFDSILSKITNDNLKQTLYDFIEMRKAIKKPLTKRGLELLIKKLNDLATNDNDKIKILNESILNNWQGIFPLKNNASNSNNNFSDVAEAIKQQEVPTITQEEMDEWERQNNF